MNPQSFTVEYPHIVPQLITDCGVSEAYLANSNMPHPKFFKFKALWDTGATGTSISANVVQALGLIPIRYVDVCHAGGIGKAGLYKLNILLPNGIEFPVLNVLDGELSGFDMLIGMDIITKGDFAITHSDNKTTFTFRIPSVEKLDFVEAAQTSSPSSPPLTRPIKSDKKIGRNEPCPCGSGKKYKHCHGK